jgi:hypothetical protein
MATTNETTDPEFEAWLETRPQSVQRLAREFPLGTCVRVPEGLLYLLGWTEFDQLIVSPINPSDDYDGANGDKRYINADDLRSGLN